MGLTKNLGALPKVLTVSGSNIGIGTASPTEVLTISGSTRITGQATNFSAGSPGLNIDRIAATGLIRMYGVTGTGTAGDLSLGTNNTERIRITSGGNVGIGTETPINGGNAAKWVTADGTTTYGGGFISSLNGDAKAYFYSQDGYAIVQGSSSQGIKLMPNGSNGVTVLSGGNVGIGTATPTTKLDVQASGVAAWFTSTSDAVPLSVITNGLTISTVGFKGSTTDNQYVVRCGADGNNFVAYTNNTERMRINTSGQITTPSQPAFRAWYSINATWTLASNAVFNFNVTEYNTGNCFNTSNGTFTAPVAGVYQFNFYTIVLGTYTNGAISFRKNGGVATSGYNVHFSPTAADAWSNVVYTTSMYLNQGDYVNMVNAGGFSTNFHGKDWSSFSGYLVG